MDRQPGEDDQEQGEQVLAPELRTQVRLELDVLYVAVEQGERELLIHDRPSTTTLLLWLQANARLADPTPQDRLLATHVRRIFAFADPQAVFDNADLIRECLGEDEYFLLWGTIVAASQAMATEEKAGVSAPKWQEASDDSWAVFVLRRPNEP